MTVDDNLGIGDEMSWKTNNNFVITLHLLCWLNVSNCVLASNKTEAHCPIFDPISPITSLKFHLHIFPTLSGVTNTAMSCWLLQINS